ncbi:MAG: leucine-rich repeat domain-containing protein, partial [Bacillota bacterium]|nr:leucine-rich repeat domain-containing protein [Bacillota bacterium]
DIKGLKPGEKLVIAGEDYEDCVALIVDSISIKGDIATITTKGGGIQDFFDYIQIDMEIPVTEEFLDTSNLPNGVSFEAKSSSGASFSSADAKLSDVSTAFKFGLNVQKSNVKISGALSLKLTVDAEVCYDFRLFGKDYLKCDVVTTVENVNSAAIEITKVPGADDFINLPLGEVNIPLGLTGLFAVGEINFAVKFDGSIKAEVSSSMVKESGFNYDSDRGTIKIDSSDSAENKFAVTVEGSVSAGVEADIGVSLVKVLKASVTGGVGLEGKAEADIVGGETDHHCFLCFDGELLRYAESELKLTTGTGSFKATPVNITLYRNEWKLKDFYCSFGNETADVSFGWGACPNKNGGGGDIGDENIIDSGTFGNGLQWRINNFGGLTISGTGAMPNFVSGDNQPWKDHMEDITAVTVEDGVTTIGDYAFYQCEALMSVSLPNSLETIGECAFYQCALTSVTVPYNVTTVKDRAFAYCTSLTSAKLPNTVTSLGQSVFFHCEALTSVNIPNQITEISYELFYYCESLTDIEIPESVTVIGERSFMNCEALTSVTLPDGLTTIKPDAFYCCINMASINIPENVTSIGQSSFAACYHLKSVTIPVSVTSIDFWAFSQCLRLTAIEVDSDNPNYQSENGVLFTKGGGTLHTYPPGKENTSYSIPNGTTIIGEDAFRASKYLTSVTIPSTVTTIGIGAFTECSALESIRIPNGVTVLENDTFWYCTSLKTVYLPRSVTTIKNRVFKNCSALKEINYGGSEADRASIALGSDSEWLMGSFVTWNYNR